MGYDIYGVSPKMNKDYPERYNEIMEMYGKDGWLDWDKKIPTCVFRGGMTGCGMTKETNMRLKAAILSKQWTDEGIDMIDAKLTGWNKKPKVDFKGKSLPWRYRPYFSGGGLVMDIGCHTLDIIEFVTG